MGHITTGIFSHKETNYQIESVNQKTPSPNKPFPRLDFMPPLELLLLEDPSPTR